MEKINIGLDLGVASVGWSVYSVDQDKILDKGVKLFYQANKAEDRRGARALRRRYKRQNHRIERFEQVLKSNNLILPNEIDSNMLETRIKGQSELITTQELVNILRFFLKYRGYNPTANDTRENEYKVKYPDLIACEVQKIILEETGHYRGLEYPFLIADFEKEITKLLETQIKYNSEITKELKNDYLEIFKSRREFWEGPGGNRIDQLTPFGRYRNTEDLKKVEQDISYRKYLYQELIKDCSIYLNEKSVSKDNYYAQRFNFLNDMLNLRFKAENITVKNEKYFIEHSKDTYQLNLEGIKLLEEAFLTANSINVKSIFKKQLHMDINEASGFRIDRSKKIEITKFDLLKKVTKKLKANDLSLELVNNIEYWNIICEIKAIVPVGNQEEQLIDKLPIQLTKEEIAILVNENFTGQYHSYSEKALKVFIKNMEQLLINSSTLEKKYPDVINNEVDQYMVDNYFVNDVTIKMSKRQIDDLVASPQVKKSLRKVITTFNQIRKEYSVKKGYSINAIVIESNKEMLNDAQKKDFESDQLENEKLRQAALKEIEHLINSKDNTEKLIEKQVLLMETNYKCVYCDDIVNINTMEIEHILPISKSADDSMANKVCSCHKCNHDKGNKTAYEYINTSGKNWDDFVKRVEKLKISSDKLRNLTFTDNINKYEKRFIARNLRDTAYATKELNNQFNIYRRALIEKRGANEKDLYTVISMPPKITGKVRRQLLEAKDRTKHYHHAFDASICAMYPTTKLGELSNKIQNQPDKYWMVKLLDEDIEKMTKFFKFTNDQVSQLKDINYDNTRFHSEVKQTANGHLCNADINKVIIKDTGTGKKTKQEYRKIEYIANIYELDNKSIKKLDEMLLKENSSKVLGIKYNDKPTFEFIKNIYLEYKDLKYRDEKGKDVWLNPFVHYCVDNHDVKPLEVTENLGKYGIRPVSKKGKQRPVIKRLNYDVKVNEPFILRKKNVDMKPENMVMLDKLKTAYTIVYENLDKGGYLFLPVYSISCNLKTGEPNTDHPYYQQLYKSLIGDTKVKMVFTLNTNDYVRITKSDGTKIEGRFYGYDKDGNRCSLKHKPNGKTQFRFTRNTLKIEKIDVYGLGIYGMNLDE